MGARLLTGRRWVQYELQEGSGDLGEQRGVTLITVRTQSSLHGEDPAGLLISEAEAQKDEKNRLSLFEGRDWRHRKFRFT